MNDKIPMTMEQAAQHAAEVRAAQQKRLREAAERYIAADRTDPFARMRVYSHLRNGIATPMRGLNPDAQLESYYDAERYSEKRAYGTSPNQVEYTVPAYRSMVRP
jgi:hypothetical protein